MCNSCFCNCAITFSKISIKDIQDINSKSGIEISKPKNDEPEAKCKNFGLNSKSNYMVIGSPYDLCHFDDKRESKHTLYQTLLKISTIDHVDTIWYIAKAFSCCEENLGLSALTNGMVQHRIELLIKKFHDEFVNKYSQLNTNLQLRAPHLFDVNGKIKKEVINPLVTSTPTKKPPISRLANENHEEIRKVRRKLIF